MEEEIFKIIYNYYPRNIDSNVDYYLTTTEFKKLKSVLKTAQDNVLKWNTFLDKLRVKFSNKYEIEDWTQFFNHDACYICRLSYSSIENEFIDIVINVSVISNYYSIYASRINKIGNKFTIPIIDYDLNEFPHEFITAVKGVLNICFPNHVKFPRELTEKTILDISLGNKNYGSVTFFDCIFTTHIW